MSESTQIEKNPRWMFVGEHGPELVRFRRGGRIIPKWEKK